VRRFKYEDRDLPQMGAINMPWWLALLIIIGWAAILHWAK